jgi:hypothetical protein
MQAGLPLASDISPSAMFLPIGRRADFGEIVIFHSIGLGIQDACAAYCSPARLSV